MIALSCCWEIRGFDGCPRYCQETPHVRSCSSFHQLEPKTVAIDNSGSRAGYEMRSSLVEVLPVTEPKENETISRQQLAVASEWRPLPKFSSGCNAITIILSLRKLSLRPLNRVIFDK
ncbi:hypothetical protein CISIN_1g047255mg [Citrus sinensis]|uniref:Uncharacterized protein n=1 Tax=Citrus sinensis TaxID=2711 RepID=A0A067DHG9_CITSI|nr:hypothetical protein CISIN_1g047255mg [Citrus sinensis]